MKIEEYPFRERLIVIAPDTAEREVFVRHLEDKEPKGLTANLNVLKNAHYEFVTFQSDDSNYTFKIDDIYAHIIEPNPKCKRPEYEETVETEGV